MTVCIHAIDNAFHSSRLPYYLIVRLILYTRKPYPLQIYRSFCQTRRINALPCVLTISSRRFAKTIPQHRFPIALNACGQYGQSYIGYAHETYVVFNYEHWYRFGSLVLDMNNNNLFTFFFFHGLELKTRKANNTLQPTNVFYSI